ncbi:MAG: DUF2341 domain-containing protein [Promethearchaeota archaeon]
MKKVNFKAIILILLFTCSSLSIINLSDILIKNNRSHNNLDNLNIKIPLANSPINYTDFNFYKVITIDNTKVSGIGSHTNFPLLISIIDKDLRQNVQSNGNDIAFAIGNEWLDHEIEVFNQNYSATHAHLVAWVRIPSLSTSVDTEITMYYGNPTMDARENPTGVWNNNYKGVWHLKEDPSISQVKDSTSNSYHGTPHGSMSSNDQVKGHIAGSLEFDGRNDYISLGNNSGLKPINSFTIETWYNGIFNTTIDTRSPIFCSGFSWGDQIGIRVQGFHSSSSRNARIAIGDGLNMGYAISDYGINDNIWTHLVGTYDGTTLKLYINGSKQVDEFVNNIDFNANNATIGINLDSPSLQLYKGKIDELRLLNTTCSADWIATEFNNQYEPSSFYSVSREYTTFKRPPNVNSFNFRKEITIDHTKVSGSSSLINFSVLISMYDSDLHDHAQPDGDDIVFTNGIEWLDHEIELFNQDFNITHAQLIAWVRIPSLSTSTDTKIYMYYGNSTMGPQENPMGVWNPNYVGVYHLNDAPTGIMNDVYDSTYHGNNGITNGSMDNIDLVNSQIGKGYDFDGIDDFINISRSSSLNSINDEGTLSLWINWVNSSKTGEYQRIMTTSNRFNRIAPNHRDGFEWSVNQNGDNFFYPWGGNSLNYNLKTNPFTNGIWHYLIVTFNYSNRNVTMYLDGSPSTFDIINVDTYWTQLAQLEDWLWGASVNISQLGHFEGKYDEIRISSKTHSADWIATEYNNQNDPKSFYSVGIEETNLARNVNYFAYYKVITINSTMVTGLNDLINFPVLISLFDSDLHIHTQTDGDDIAFYSGDTWLDHEIELFNQSYSATHAQLIIWVRIPSLSSSIDTNITMYYGNSTMGSQENPMGVWNPNYVGVWHLKEIGIGTVNEYADSSHYGNHGQGGLGNITYIPSKVTGSIGYGQNFSDHFIDCGNDTSLDLTTNQITIQLWMKYPLTHPWMGPLNHKGFYNGYRLVMDLNSQLMSFQLPGNESDLETAQTISSDIWHHVVATYNGTEMRIYVDGIPDPATLSKTNNIVSALPFSFRIGHGDQPEGVAWSYPWLGQIDEVRISQVGRSADWIATEYNNQYDPDSFYSVGAEYQSEDTSGPEITINSPNLNDIFGSSAPNYDLTVTDPNLDSIWYTLDGGATNSTPVSASGTIDQNMWSALGNGTVTIRFYANDTLGNISYKEIIVRKDIIKPSISINSPSPGSNHSTPPSYSLSITEANRDKIWYTLNDGLNNYTGALSGTINSIAWGNAGLGAVTITFYVNDSVGNWDSASVGVTKTSDLSISINLPNAAEWFRSNPDYDVYVSGNDRDSIWYTFDNGLNNYTITSSANLTDTWFGIFDSTAWDNAGQGSNTITFYLNNTFGIETSDSVQIYKDTINPSIDSIDSPLSGAWFSTLPPSYTLSITESNRDRIWYTLDGGLNNYTGALSGTIDSIAWNNAGQGSITIIFYVNDSAGNWDTASVVIYRDSINPSIDSIDSPLSGAWFSSLPPSYTLSITESNRDRIWYTLDGGLNNYTGALSGTIDSIAWNNAGQGSITIIFYVNDSAGNWDTASVVIYRDSINPSIDSIDSPLSGAWFSNLSPSYTLSITESNRDNIWYTLDGGLNNYTGALSGTIDSTAWNNAGQGSITIIFYVNDSAGNWDAASVVINRDTISPTVTIIEPTNYELFGNEPPDITININDPNLDNEWYQLDNGTIITNNYTWTGFIAQSVWDQVGNGTVIIRFYANDTLGNLGSAEVIVYKDVFAPIITINNPNFNEVFNSTAPSFIVSVSGSNLDSRWYTLDDGLVNYTFTGLTGTISQLAWSAQSDGDVIIRFYINNTLGVIGFDEITIIKDTLAPSVILNLPLNNSYCRISPMINVLAIDPNLDSIWYQVNSISILLGNNINQQLDISIWNSLSEGQFYVYIYANDTVNHLSNYILLVLYKDTIAPSVPILINFPQGEVSGTLIFEWYEGSDPSGILRYRLIIDNEANPLITPGFVFEINITGNYYEYTGSLQPGTYYFFLYQIDGAGNVSPAETDSFSIMSSSQPSEFPFWIIFIVIGVAIGGVVGAIVLKKSKSKKKKKAVPIQITEKQPITKPKLKVYEEFKSLDYETLKDKTEADLLIRREKVIAHVNKLTEENDYVKAAEFAGETIIIEEILGNSQNADFYRQKQIDIAIKGLNYLKDQYEIESKKAAISGDYSKSLKLYNESKIVSENLKRYMDNQAKLEQDRKLEVAETPIVVGEVEIVYSCINDLLTKYFDEVGIKYYSNPQIYDDVQSKIHGLILFDDRISFLNIDPSIRDRIRSIQIIYTEDTSNEAIIKLSKEFQNEYTLLILVVIKWLENNESFSFQGPMKNVRINHYKAFIESIGLKGVYEEAFNEIIDLYFKGQFDILRETHELSEVIIHSTDELLYDLKEKGLVMYELKEYLHR